MVRLKEVEMGTATAIRVAKILLDVKAVGINDIEPFTYTSGIKSPIYCDLRVLVDYPKERAEIEDLLIDRMQETCDLKEVDLIVGVALSGIPWAYGMAGKLDMRMAYVRELPKEHGKKRQVEGRVVPGDVAVVIEDHISTGGSLVAVVDALRDCGAKVHHSLSIFTYKLPQATEIFRQGNLKSTSLCDIKTLLDVATSTNTITQGASGVVVGWLNEQAGEAVRVYPMHP